MVDDERIAGEADAAEAAVAGEDPFPLADEAGAGAAAAVVAPLAQAAAVELGLPAGAAERHLLRIGAHFEGLGYTYDK